MTGQTSLSAEALIDILEAQILDGTLPPGARLPSERTLAERFDLSRPTVREALRSLAERRLVEILPARGTFVTEESSLDALRPLDLVYRRRHTTARQLVEARVMLETQAAELAASRATPEDLELLRQTLERMEATTDHVEHVRLDLGFHLAITRAAHNPVIETMFASTASMTVELMLRSVADPAVARRSHPYHRQAYEAIARGDGRAAREALRGHLRVADETYGADYDRPLDVTAHRELQRLLGSRATLSDFLRAVLDRVSPEASRLDAHGLSSDDS